MKLKIVAVDDDKKVTIFIKKELEKLGHEIFTAGDGESGLKLVEKHQPDLLICDMLIPGIHGSELSKQLKSNEEYDSLKIILMTGVYKKINWLLEKKSWTDGFIEKPFEISKLISLMDKVMNKKGRRHNGK